MQSQKNDERCPWNIFQRKGGRTKKGNDWYLRKMRYQNVPDYAEEVILFLPRSYGAGMQKQNWSP